MQGTLIKLENFNYSIADRVLYNNACIQIESKEHIGLLGENGCGKTTLINIILHPEKYIFSGSVWKQKNARIEYVSQFLDNSREFMNKTVEQYLFESYNAQLNVLSKLENEMTHTEDLTEVLNEYQQELERYDMVGGEAFAANIEKTLQSSGLIALRHQKLQTLSGGERKILQIMRATMLLPDLLFLDEPDSFLDLGNIDVLADILNNFKGAYIMVSHNRYFLDNCCSHIVSIEDKKMRKYKGNYSQVTFNLLSTKIAEQKKAFTDKREIKRQEALVKKFREYARRNPDKRGGRMLRSRVTYLNRLKNNKQLSPYVLLSQIDFDFQTSRQNTSEILTINNYSKSFSDKELIRDASLMIAEGERAAFIGENGAGKSTLLKAILAGNTEHIHLNPYMKVSYLSQKQEERLKYDNNILDEFYDMGFTTVKSIEQFLANFLFKRDTLHRKISILSGGEKNHLQLAKITHEKPDFIILDEPTSHLDLYSQLALENAINTYQGSVLMVSHDFYMISNTMDYVFSLEGKKILKISVDEFRERVLSKRYSKVEIGKINDRQIQRRELENEIALALSKEDFSTARNICVDLGKLIRN
ncbi:MAG: ABC-F family ATP-binding cassette domain-containing protein [Clostridiales bacterium]|nr:ABC-F family ATP-binding cassette domain-containing protein [Clostridiales bacterium]